MRNCKDEGGGNLEEEDDEDKESLAVHFNN